MTTRNISLTATKSISPITRTFRRNISGKGGDPTLNPIVSSSIRPSDYVLRGGFPYDPVLHVSSDYLISADGTYIDEPVYPWEGEFKGAHTRFVSMDNLWDPIAGHWSPLYTSGVDYYFTWPLGGVEPRLDDIEYTLGKKLYQFTSIRLLEETQLNSSFNSGLDDASNFMIAMAGMINSSERASLIRVGDTVGNSITIEVDEKFYLRNQYGTSAVNTLTHPANMQPFYLVIINDPERTEIRVSNGISQIHAARIPNRDATRSLIVTLGEDLGGKTTLDMNLFELTIFPYSFGTPSDTQMSPEQIITAMADIYGVS